MKYYIRQATLQDAKLIADLSHQTFCETFGEQNTKENMDKFLSQQFTKGKIVLEVGDPANTFFLVCNNDEVVGYAKIRKNKAPGSLNAASTLEIARFYVVNSMIGKGIGGLLMQSIIDKAQQKNIQALWLGVWEKNQRAIDFYTRWGFEKFDDTLFILGDDVQNDWLMYKKI